MPIGLSKVTIGFPRVAINCAMCHTASYRLRPDDPPTIVAGGAVAPDRAAAVPPVPDRVARPTRGSRRHHPRRRSRRTRACRCWTGCCTGSRSSRARAAALRRLRRARTPGCGERPDWGRGRIDPFNPVKYTILKQPIDDDRRQLRHGAAVEPEARTPATRYHWDGLNMNLQEVVLSSALGDGATMKWVDRDFAKWNNTDPKRCRACGACRTTSATCSRRRTRSRSTARWPPPGQAIYDATCAPATRSAAAAPAR